MFVGLCQRPLMIHPQRKVHGDAVPNIELSKNHQLIRSQLAYSQPAFQPFVSFVYFHDFFGLSNNIFTKAVGQHTKSLKWDSK